MAQTTTYQCPACTGPLHFDSKLNKLKCDYCDSVYEIAQIDAIYAQKIAEAKKEAETQKQKEQFQTQKNSEQQDFSSNNQNWNSEKFHAFNCTSCGAQIFTDITTVATSCPYCGNPTVIPGQFKGGIMPDFVIPFKVDKKAAVEALKNHYKNKRFLPSVFSKENHIEEIKGVYVPFWLYDGKADASADFTATRSHMHRRADVEIVITEHFKLHRKALIPFNKVPVDASKKMDNDEMDSIEPFDYKQMVPFSTSYLPGYFAESYDESQQDCKPRLEARVEPSVYNVVRSDIKGYETVVNTSKNIKINLDKTHYAFLPVWILNTKWQNQNFQFVMNGQTGKLVGNLPVDKRKFAKYFLSIFAGCACLITILFLFLLKGM